MVSPKTRAVIWAQRRALPISRLQRIANRRFIKRQVESRKLWSYRAHRGRRPRGPQVILYAHQRLQMNLQI